MFYINVEFDVNRGMERAVFIKIIVASMLMIKARRASKRSVSLPYL